MGAKFIKLIQQFLNYTQLYNAKTNARSATMFKTPE